MDIAAWLRDLRLERYEPAFRENEIDAEVLPELTEADLLTKCPLTFRNTDDSIHSDAMGNMRCRSIEG